MPLTTSVEAPAARAAFEPTAATRNISPASRSARTMAPPPCRRRDAHSARYRAQGRVFIIQTRALLQEARILATEARSWTRCLTRGYRTGLGQEVDHESPCRLPIE